MTEPTPLLPDPLPEARRRTLPGARHVVEGECGGCGRPAEIRWTMQPLDGPAEFAGTIMVCRPCSYRVMAELAARLPDLGEAPLRGYA